MQLGRQGLVKLKTIDLFKSHLTNTPDCQIGPVRLVSDWDHQIGPVRMSDWARQIGVRLTSTAQPKVWVANSALAEGSMAPPLHLHPLSYSEVFNTWLASGSTTL